MIRQFSKRDIRYFFLDLFASLLVFLGLFISTGAIDLIKDGGARPEGYSYAVPYSGVLDYFSMLWALFSFLLLFSYVLFFNFKVFRLRASVIFLFVFSVFSLAWSISPLDTFKNIIAIISFFIIASFHIILLGKREAIYRVGDIMFLMCAFCYIYVFLFPNYGISVGRHEGSWQGIFPHKNMLGLFGVVSFLLVSFKPSKHVLIKFLKLLFISALVLFSRSYTSLGVLLAISIIWVLFVFVPYNFRVVVSHFVVISVFFLGFFSVFISVFNVNLEFFGKDTTFSSRNLIWHYTINWIMDSPVYGYGLAVFHSLSESDGEEIASFVGGIISSTHNGFLDAFYSLGVFGFFLSIYMIFESYSRDENVKLLGMLPVFFAIAFIMLNTFESNLFSFNFMIFILFYFLSCSSVTYGSMSRSYRG
ncbi:O-antigen ligase family protein [Zobellella iuensis]|uniref:O-antigen ligase family protein n=1 Tax=Zobellella iuensis TaxID=2803811 RepID=A0ABS1QNX4_9GAMM|nr:O-antigen ligase family protein [Zobellella iuensis]MBL1376558.1 O-antigen ligase family protein [Zobellella iuensis]